MRFVEVESVPEYNLRSPKKPLKELLEEFVRSNIKCAKFIFDETEYSRCENARQALLRSCKFGAFPIAISVRGNDIYLIRKDI